MSSEAGATGIFNGMGHSITPLLHSVLLLKIQMSLCLTEHHAMKTYWGEWRYSSTYS
jgi:hypothetical protein